jgi:uncharacterized membrane protein
LHQERTRGERLADAIATHIGSWRFLIIQTIAVILWIAINVVAAASGWHRYPFVLLNLLFSVLAIQRPGRLHRRGIGSVAESLGEARPDDR